MPIRISSIGLALALSALALASVAEAKTVGADIRVVGSSGETLVEQTQYTPTGATKVRTDPGADCFGPGSGGSGDRATVPGATALAQLTETTRTDRDAKPLSITDFFDFGLGLCGIGDAVSPQTGFWYLKRNLSASQLGGDQTQVKNRDVMLWYLIEDFNQPAPDELVLSAPVDVNDKGSVRVKVTRYADGGAGSPAVGATVTGAEEPTDAQGRTVVTPETKLVDMQATLESTIPSNVETVCSLEAAKCPAGYAATVAGTSGKDRIEGERAAETILAGGGDDRIVSTSGEAHDLIKCGAGDDKVRLGAANAKRGVLKGCEKVRASGKGK